MPHVTYMQVGLVLFGLAFTYVNPQTWPCQWKDSTYLEGSCYLLFKDTYRDYDEAKTQCASQGGVLASINPTQNFSDVLAPLSADNEIWIGAHRKTGKWVWLSTGKEATELSQLWANEQPNESPNNDCAFVYMSEVYTDYCGDSKYTLCMEIELATSTAVTTTSDLTGPCQWKESIYVEGSCFLYYNTTQKTYAKAKLYCENLGGVLASVNLTKQVKDGLSSLLSGSETWIGADNKTGTWTWLSTGQKATELNLFWASGEPRQDPVNMCAYILNAKAYNGYCGDSWNFLCMEINLATTTAANTASTLTDPCQWLGSVYSEGACYLYNSTALTYVNAKTSCLDRGGVLAVVNSSQQITDALSSAPSGSYWIGARKESDTWTWLNSSTEATQLAKLWAAGQPSTLNLYDCAYVKPSNAYSAYCGDSKKFLCMEIDVASTKSSTSELTTSQSESISQTTQPATTVTSAPESTSAQSDTSYQTTYPTTIISSTIESSTKHTGSLNETIGGFTSNARVDRISIVSTSLIYVLGNLITVLFTTNQQNFQRHR